MQVVNQKVSIANMQYYYEVEGTGNSLFCKRYYQKEFSMTGIDNYGLKPDETKIKGRRRYIFK